MTNKTDLELIDISPRVKLSSAISPPPSSSAMVEVSSPSTTPSSPLLEKKESLIESFQKLLEPVLPEFYDDFLKICAKKSLDEEKCLPMLVFLLANTGCIPIDAWNKQRDLMQRVLDHIGGPISEDDPLREFADYALSKGCQSENLDALPDFKGPKKLTNHDTVRHLLNFFLIWNGSFFREKSFRLAFNFLDNFSKQETVTPKLSLSLLKRMSAGNNFKNLKSQSLATTQFIRKFLSFLDQQKENCPAQVLACLTDRNSGMELGYRITSREDAECARQFLTLISDLNQILKNSQTKLLQCLQDSGFPILRKKDVTLNNQFLELLIFLTKGNLPKSTAWAMLKSPDFSHSARISVFKPNTDPFFPNLFAAVVAQDDVQFKINFFKFVKKLRNPKKITHFIVPKMLMQIKKKEGGYYDYGNHSCEFNANTTFNQLILKKDWETLLFLFKNDFIGGDLFVNNSGYAFAIFDNSGVTISKNFKKSDPVDKMNGFQWLNKYRRKEIEKILEEISGDRERIGEDGKEKIKILLQLDEWLDKCINPNEFKDSRLPTLQYDYLKDKKNIKLEINDDEDVFLKDSALHLSKTDATPILKEKSFGTIEYKSRPIKKESTKLMDDFVKSIGKNLSEEQLTDKALQFLENLYERKISPIVIIELMQSMKLSFPFYTGITNSEKSVDRFFKLLEYLSKFYPKETLQILIKPDITFSYVLASRNCEYGAKFLDFISKLPGKNEPEILLDVIRSLRFFWFPIMAKSNTDDKLKLKFLVMLDTISIANKKVKEKFLRLIVEPFSAENLCSVAAQNNFAIKDRFLTLLRDKYLKDSTKFILPNMVFIKMDERGVWIGENFNNTLFSVLIRQNDGETLCSLMTKGLLEGKFWATKNGIAPFIDKRSKDQLGQDKASIGLISHQESVKFENGYDWLKVHGGDTIKKAKDAIYDYILRLPISSKKYQLAKVALDPKTNLGKFFALKSDRYGMAPRKGVGTLGKLEKIYDDLKDIFEQKPKALSSGSSSHSAFSSSSVSSSSVMVETQRPQASSSRFLGSSSSSSSSHSASSSASTLLTLSLIKDSKQKIFLPGEDDKRRILSHIESLKIGLKYHLGQRDKLVHLPPDDERISPILEGIKAHEQRIEALKKILKGDGITSHERELLLRIPQLAEDSYINEYANILPDATAGWIRKYFS